MMKQVIVRLDPQFYEHIRACAAREGRPISNYIRFIAQQHTKYSGSTLTPRNRPEPPDMDDLSLAKELDGLDLR